MKKILIILLCISYCSAGFGQEVMPEQQLENLADIDQAETEDDSYVQQLEQFRKSPVNLNKAGEEELSEFLFLTALQIENLMSYRQLLGKFISIYELQSVPGWDVATIKKIMPYVTIADEFPEPQDLKKMLAAGNHRILLRVSEILEKSKGFQQAGNGYGYPGSRERIFFRYQYKFKNLIQYGLSGDKDAGEQFFKGARKYGFDFYSFHLFARNLGPVRDLAIGDFTVNLGQGLIQWQSLGFKKSGEVMGVKRQSAILRPYNSSGESNFHRGIGLTLKMGKKVEVTGYVSSQKLDATIQMDTTSGIHFISSFLISGYHRTVDELERRRNLRQVSYGGNISLRSGKVYVGLNTVGYIFSLPVHKRDEAYNLFSVNGKHWTNHSLDYSYTRKNFHLFGEAAIDKNLQKAFLSGLLIGVDPRVDISLVYRSIGQGYASVYGNAFTENSYPGNERGFYMGISIRPPINGWRLDFYADHYKFPWLKYMADAPAYGIDYLAQLTFTPNKQLEIYSRVRSESKQSNDKGNTSVMNFLVLIPKQSWRTQLNFKMNQIITLRHRIELLWYDNKGSHEENGFLMFFDILIKPLLKPYSGNIRLQYFETASYNSRIYAYENDVLYSFSIPSFYGKGYRYYLNLYYSRNKFSFWFRWAGTVYRDRASIGNALDEISGSQRSEIKLQSVLFF